MSNWISVHDQRKPEGGQMILVYVKGVTRFEREDGNYDEDERGEVAIGEFLPELVDRPAYFDSYSGGPGEHWWVTHWQPLPAPPAESE